MHNSLPTRKPMRLSTFDYGCGAYFVTVCTKDRSPILRTPLPDFDLTDDGNTAETLLLQVPAHYPDVSIEKYVVMPNHVHVIFTIAGGSDCAPSLSRVVAFWKSSVSRALGRQVWQRGYYDHVLRDEDDFLRIWKYIDDNPAKWVEDEYFTR